MRKELLEWRELKKETNLRVFIANTVSTPQYGCETWTVQKRCESRLQVCEMTLVEHVHTSGNFQ